jgi:putative FmdB family regulatory protein
MPLYEYQCDACGQRFEVIQKRFSDPDPEACARCGKGPIHRMLSTPAIQFKGSGWYITDYAGGRSSAASSTSATESSGEGKGDSGDKKDSATKKESAPAKTESAPKSDSSSSSTSAPKSTAKE